MKENKYYLKSIDEIYKDFGTNKSGLSKNIIKDRLIKYGKNKLAEKKKKSIFSRFVEQIFNPMIIILLVAAFISYIVSLINKESNADVYIILFVVIVNAILGVIQEAKAENAIDALKEMTKSITKVIRNGNVEIVNSEDLVVGDIICIEAGEIIPADCRIIESNLLKCDESSLTGESNAVKKSEETLIENDVEITLGDRKNMLYMGSTCVYGRGIAVVVNTGMDTEMGKIASVLIEAKDEETPLQKKLRELSKALTYLVIIICIVVFVVSVIKAGSFDLKKVIIPSFVASISLAVAAIPEGLAAVVTIVLSIGVTRMSKKKAIIRKLTAVETLGCVNVICSDKTGTLTKNEMTVVDSYSYTDDEKLLSKIATLCSDSEIKDNKVIGEPTENALVYYAKKMGLDKNILKEKEPRTAEIPFDSERKMMSTFHNNIQYCKGAPDIVLEKCIKYYKNGNEYILDDITKKEILDKNKKMADKALRVLLVAYRKYETTVNEPSSEENEKDLVFVGLIGMIDPIRKEVFSAIEKCVNAGIRTIMITGDYKATAIAIGKELSIIENDDQALSGNEIDNINDEDFIEIIKTHSVFARVKPEHKVRIVKALKSIGFTTAMTGDGVNDAPSIKTADVGIGMGITGTDVTKNVSDIVLADDNFKTIVSAIEEGRIIYSNIKKAIQFLLSSNLAEVMTVFIATMYGFVILKAPHLLWINLITDCFPALALGMDLPEKNIMLNAPRDKNESFFKFETVFDILYQGLVITILTLIAYNLGNTILFDVSRGTKEMQGITMAFLTMSMAEIFHSFNMRDLKKSILKFNGINYWLIGGLVISLTGTYIVIEIPFFAKMFEFVNLNVKEYIIALLIALMIIPITEIVKLLKLELLKNK